MGKTRIVADLSGLKRLTREFPAKADAMLRSAVFETQADIMSSFAGSSPSSPGQPPAVVTGNLKNSITVKKIKVLSYVLNVGAEYGLPLEFGTRHMAARPFIRPAVMRFPGRLERIKMRLK